MPAFTRRQYAGAAAATTITAGINPSDTTCSLAATTGWPSTAAVPFYVVIDPGTSAEEKCSATISGSTLTLVRAQDDTTATSHSSGATIYPVFTANDADEANEVVAKLTTKGDLLVTTGSALNRLAVGTNGHQLTADSAATNGVKWALSPETDLVTTKGDILVATAADTLARQGIGTNNHVLTAASGETNGLKWSAIDNVSLGNVGATTAYTPTMSGWALGNGTLSGTYNLVNKLCNFTIRLVCGSTTTFAGNPSFTIPLAYSSGTEFDAGVSGLAYDASANARYPVSSFAISATTFGSIIAKTDATHLGSAVDVSSTVPFTWTTGDVLLHTFTYSVA
jgi:hypothetical protein